MMHKMLSACCRRNIRRAAFSESAHSFSIVSSVSRGLPAAHRRLPIVQPLFGNLGGVRSMFIQTADTPNPNGLKFQPGVEVLPSDGSLGTAIDFRSLSDAQISPLARKLFQIKEVEGVFFAPDFITITKKEDAFWDVVKLDVFSVIMDFYATGEPVVSADQVDRVSAAHASTLINDDDDEVVALIKELLETRIRPAVMEDGGDIFFVDFNESDGIVQLRLAGSCAGCPSSSVTLKNGVENMLMHYIPEVKGVAEVGGEEGDDNPAWF